MIATPSASSTTPTSSGSPLADDADEHRHVGIVGLEASPVVSQRVEHVVIGDNVLAGARLDVHPVRLRIGLRVVNIC